MSKDRSSLMSQTNINNASNTVIHINDGQSMQPFNDNESATKDVINVRWGCTLSPQKSPCALKLKKEYSTAVSCTYCNRNNIFEYYYCDKDRCIMCLICGAEQPITPPHTPIRGTNTHSKRQKTRKRTLSLSVLGDEPDNKRRKYGMGAELKGEDFDELNNYTDDMMNCLKSMKEYNYNLKKRFMEYRQNKQAELEAKDRDIYEKNERIGELERLIQQLSYEQKKHGQIVEEKNKEINWWKNHEKELKQLLADEQETRKQIVGRKNKEIEKLRKENNKKIEELTQEKDKEIEELKQKIEESKQKIKELTGKIKFWSGYEKEVRKWTKLGEKLQLFNSNDI